MPTLTYKESLGESAGRPISLLDATQFSDIFVRWRAPFDLNGQRYPRIPVRKNTFISDYCSAFDTPLENSLHVVPTAAVVECIMHDMVIPEWDAVDFRLIRREDGVLVTARPNRIIGGLWLALLEHDVFTEIRNGVRGI